MPEEFERDFRKDVTVDRYKLDEECAEHSPIYLYWVEQLVGARTDLDTIKNQLHLTIAQTELDLRKNPPEGLKITESGVAALVISNTDVNKKKEEQVQAQRKANLLSGVVTAMEHRKGQLTNLKDLSISGYYSRPAGTKAKTGTDEAEDDSRIGLNKKE